ncbi:hypothetical protein K461DRAFT_210476, partial [Myriangium duriaei CBS 260.36]
EQSESAAEEEVDDEELSELASGEDNGLDMEDEESAASKASVEPEPVAEPAKRRRKKTDEHDDLEAKYLKKLSKDVAKSEKAAKKANGVDVSDDEQTAEPQVVDSDHESAGEGAVDNDAMEVDSDAELLSPPPVHETLAPESNEEFEKAQRTVFLGNVSTTAITSKSALKTLNNHLTSFFSTLPAASSTDPPRALSSLRFRSTPFASAIPKRAAFARKEVMDATTHSTNAYAVYSTPSLAREACKRLNGSTVLDRHLRVDSVAHPAKVDHKRCIFVGNLGFVDDESLIDAANAESGREQRKGKKVPSDVEEGLWRTFALCGQVESVRVVRDPKTRVGKGFAYVQFTDENAVEAALLNNDKKFPPMLPRKLRVVRAKPVKRNQQAQRRERDAKAEGKRRGGYVKKLTPQEQSQMGRAAKLLGKNAAGQMRRSGGGLKAPESFVFEGHRARSGAKPGLKMKKGSGKKAKPTKNSGKRAAAWKAK